MMGVGSGRGEGEIEKGLEMRENRGDGPGRLILLMVVVDLKSMVGKNRAADVRGPCMNASCASVRA